MRASRLPPFRMKQGIVDFPSCFIASRRCQPITKCHSGLDLPHSTARTVIGLSRPNEEMDSASSFNLSEFNARRLSPTLMSATFISRTS